MDRLFIVDAEYTDLGTKVTEKATRVQEIWNDFIRISDEITAAQGAIAGSRANAYNEFIGVAKTYIATLTTDTATETSKDLNDYISMIDEADQALY